MRQYPIWNKIEACVYKGSKSYGVKETGEVEILVGTSSRNSHHFLDHMVTHREDAEGNRVYQFSVDGVVIKKAVLFKGKTELDIYYPSGFSEAVTYTIPKGILNA